MDKVDAVARAIAGILYPQAVGLPSPFDKLHPSQKRRVMDAARAAEDVYAKHDADNGLVTVPRVPTDAMRRVVAAQWGRRTWDEYQAVIAAAPRDGEGGT